MKRLFVLVVLMLMGGSLFAQNSASTRVVRLDTTVTTAWIKITLPTANIPRSTFSLELENGTAGTLYFAFKNDTAYASTAGGWRYSNSLVCATTGTPVFFYLDNCWTPHIWLKASTTTAAKIRIW